MKMCELHGELSNVRYFVTINYHLFTLLNVDFECVITVQEKEMYLYIVYMSLQSVGMAKYVQNISR